MREKNRIPLGLSDSEPNQESRAALAQARKIVARIPSCYADDMFDALGM